MSQNGNVPIATSDLDFSDQVLNADVPVLVDFWAEWCGPCRVLGPVIDSLSADYADRARVAKLDVDASQETAMKFGIRSIPTVMLFNNGEVVDTWIGVKPKSAYEQGLDRVLADGAA